MQIKLLKQIGKLNKTEERRKEIKSSIEASLFFDAWLAYSIVSHYDKFWKKLKMGQPRPLFVYFRTFQTQILQKKLYASAGFELRLSE